MHASIARVSACLLVGLLAGAALAVNIETVPVGNPGNAADTQHETPGYGSVGYTYNIAKYEVTAGQYCEFLNAVAITDTYGLYNINMWSSTYGCKIKQNGSSGSFSYTVASDWANRPVNYVSWGDAARFSNWLHNGWPTGEQDLSTTEDGAYLLNGAMTDEALLAVNRKSNWKWAITTEDEWYKAAYHKNDGVTGDYWDYPTGTNSTPSNVLGNPTDPGNNATYGSYNCYTIGGPYYRTEVGAHENSESPYGTFDQGGNVMEWNESVLYSVHRGLRGGSWYKEVFSMSATETAHTFPTYESSVAGFRVVELPEPGTILLLALAGVGILRRRRA
jgi:formylglycine-generating enzyme